MVEFYHNDDYAPYAVEGFGNYSLDTAIKKPSRSRNDVRIEAARQVRSRLDVVNVSLVYIFCGLICADACSVCFSFFTYCLQHVSRFILVIAQHASFLSDLVANSSLNPSRAYKVVAPVHSCESSEVLFIELKIICNKQHRAPCVPCSLPEVP